MTLTKEEIEMIKGEAEEFACIEYPFARHYWVAVSVYTTAATKYLLQLKAERLRAGKLMEAAEQISHLHACEQEGLGSGQPTPAQWFDATNKLAEEIHNYKNKP